MAIYQKPSFWCDLCLLQPHRPIFCVQTQSHASCGPTAGRCAGNVSEPSVNQTGKKRCRIFL